MVSRRDMCRLRGALGLVSAQLDLYATHDGDDLRHFGGLPGSNQSESVCCKNNNLIWTALGEMAEARMRPAPITADRRLELYDANRLMAQRFR
jgi:hypothetical protein